MRKGGGTIGSGSCFCSSLFWDAGSGHYYLITESSISGYRPGSEFLIASSPFANYIGCYQHVNSTYLPFLSSNAIAVCCNLLHDCQKSALFQYYFHVILPIQYLPIRNVFCACFYG